MKVSKARRKPVGGTEGLRFARSTWIAVLLLAVLGLAAAGWLISCQKWGVGVTPDSTVYIAAARSLAAGGGYVTDVGLEHPRPLTEYPPLFPAALAALDVLGLDPIDGSLWLNGLLLAANAFLGGLAVYRATGGARWMAVFAAATIATGTAMLLVHSTAWSEPLFLLLSLGGAMLLGRHLDRGGWGPLLASAACFALAFLARYIGLALIGSAAIAMLLLSRASWRRRLLDTAAFGLVAGAPGIAWLVRNRFVGGSATYGAGLAFHPIPFGHLLQAMETIGQWFWPAELGALAGTVRILALAGALALIAVLWRRTRQPGSAPAKRPADERSGSAGTLAPLLATLAGGYFAFLVLSISFVAVNTPMTPRILSPVFLSGLVAALSWLGRLPVLHAATWRIRLSLAGAAVVFAVTGVLAGARWLDGIREHGQGFHSRMWRSAPVVEFLKDYRGHAVIYSDWHNPLYILTGKPVLRLPLKYEPASLRTNDKLAEELQAIRRRCDSGEGGLLVLFRLRGRPYLPTEKELVAALQPLRAVYDDRFSVLYQIPPRKPRPRATSPTGP